MYKQKQLVWFVDYTKEIPRIFWGEIINVITRALDTVYDIEIECSCCGTLVERVMFHNVLEQNIYTNKEEAEQIRKDWFKKREEDKQIEVNLSYTKEQLNELLDTLWLCRNLINKYIYEEDTKHGDEQLEIIDDLIDCITINQNIERFD